MEYKSPAIKSGTLTQKIQGFAERYFQATKRFLAKCAVGGSGISSTNVKQWK